MTRIAVDDRRRLLVEAAARVVARDGMAEASTRAITTEAGMPRGTFHYCFRSKDELLEALVRRHVKDMVDAACATWDDRAPLAENLRAGMRAMARVGMGDPGEELLSYELTVYALRRAETATVARHQYDDYARQAGDYLRFVARRSGATWGQPVDRLARMLVVMVDGTMLQWLADRDTAGAEIQLCGFAEMLASIAVTSDAPRP